MASSKQYGARYGLKPKKKLDKVFKLREMSVKCPYCLKNSVTRLAAGIWYCKSCSSKFAGGAYTYNPKDFKFSVEEADFLKKTEVKEEDNTLTEGYDQEQDVSF